jgi:EmrB/QacA subfamily drug resistance transporter
MVGLLLVLTLASLDQNIVATALPGIVSELGGLAHLSWVVTAFLVASTATTPLYGKLSDSYGRRALFFVAVGIFLAGSALCGLAQGMGQLIAFRAVQGLGAGGLITLSQTTVGDLLAPRERGRYQGLFTAVFAACSVAGPLLGGFITDALSWRWIFYINLPIGAVALALIATTLRRPNRVVHHRIDFAGAALMVGGTVFAILVLTLDSSREGWSRPGTWVEAAASVACFALLVWHERNAVEPILPPRLFRDRVFVVGASVMGLTAVALFGAVIFLPLYFQLVLGAAASKSGLMLSPLMGGVIVASVVGGRLLSRTGRYKFLPVTGLSVACVAFLLLSWLAQSQASVLALSSRWWASGSGWGW